MDARASDEEALRRAEPTIRAVVGAFKRKWDLGCLDPDDLQQEARVLVIRWTRDGAAAGRPEHLHKNLTSSLRKYVVAHAHSPNAPDGSDAQVSVVSLQEIRR